MGRIVIWIVCLALLSLTYVAAIHFKVDDIESDLKDRSDLALLDKDIAWAKVTINGRDAILNGIAPDPESVEKAKDAIMSVWGIRVVECRCQISEKNSQSEENKIPAATSPTKFLTQTDLEPLAETLDNNKVSVTKKENTDREKKVDESEINHSADQCQENINDLLKDRSIEFASGSNTISSESFSLLEELMTITQSCPGKQIKIAGHTDSVGSTEKNSTLSLERAEAVLDYFKNGGVPIDRFKAIGYGDSSPIVSNDTDEDRKRNRRIEFHITP